ncbi:MAG: FAD-binding oxidoreductase [Gammaproteobacteria bacterium]|nr:FAD-binding oxidoreductase [Gammaproteobacteria bacterium]
MEPASTPDLVTALTACIGPGRVITDPVERALLSSDLYAEGATCAVAIRPADTAGLAAAVALITHAGLAVIPRGGGLSYTLGSVPDTGRAVVVDTRDLAGIVELDTAGMTLTVRTGTTWEAIDAALAPQGLRLPYFGTFSGRAATVGGGLSGGALFFGTARYGAAADNVLDLEIVRADGRVLRTGQAAFRNGKPFYRTHGPDLTGLFLHDGGALGIKTEATFRLIERPTHTGFLSWAFPDAASAAAALSGVGRAGLAEEAYVFDPATTARGMAASNLASDLRRLRGIVTGQGGLLAGLRAGTRVVLAGKRLVPAGCHSLHLVCAARTAAALAADLDHSARRLARHGGQEIPNSIPMGVRAQPFDNLNGVLGPQGERWLALNAKVRHGDAQRIIGRFEGFIAGYRERMAATRVSHSTLFTAMNTHAFSFEAVYHWPDRWLPMHRATADPAFLARLPPDTPNPAGAALVAELRERTLDLYDELGVASNQLGRTYRYYDNLAPDTRALVDALKTALDPAGLMNPGVLASRRVR